MPTLVAPKSWPTLRRLLALAVVAGSFPAAAQSVPNADYSDMWWNPAESGWGLSIIQHSSHRVYAVWYTYDPRAPDPTTGSTSDAKPLWIVMNGGTWTAPNTLTGSVFVANGTPYYQGWNPGSHTLTPVGTFTFVFADASRGSFTYDIAPPGGLPSDDPAYGLPPMSGTKSIQRQGF